MLDLTIDEMMKKIEEKRVESKKYHQLADSVLKAFCNNHQSEEWDTYTTELFDKLHVLLNLFTGEPEDFKYFYQDAYSGNMAPIYRALIESEIRREGSNAHKKTLLEDKDRKIVLKIEDEGIIKIPEFL